MAVATFHARYVPHMHVMHCCICLHLFVPPQSASGREESTTSRGLRINSEDVVQVTKESFMMLRGAAPAFDPVLNPAAALPSMSEKEDPTLQPGRFFFLLGYGNSHRR